jgi:hypothetical protein
MKGYAERSQTFCLQELTNVKRYVAYSYLNCLEYPTSHPESLVLPLHYSPRGASYY